MTRRGWWWLVALALLAGVWLVTPRIAVAPPGPPTPAAPGTATSPRPAPASPTAPARRGASGLPTCELAQLPPEVADAVAAIGRNGPYLRPRDDGGVFGNRERLLPLRSGGYYREYTVAAPRERFPGPRRIVTGGQARPGAGVRIWFYTADHYESFCEVLGAPLS